MQYQAPVGTDARVTTSVLPGPGGMGGSPTDERPWVDLALRDRFFVTITKTQEQATLDSIKASYEANKIGSNFVGKPTATGFELTYASTNAPGTGHMIVANLGGGHYQCSFHDQNCKDVAAAEAICRSMRVKP